MKLTHKHAVAAILLILNFAAPVAAGPLDGGVAPNERGHADALQFFRSLAEKGNAQGQAMLGHMLENGLGVPQNYAEAMKWYRLAANQGNDAAQLNIGVMYAEGRGVPQDNAETHPGASQCVLGFCRISSKRQQQYAARICGSAAREA
jgi:hypothetical protein